MDSETIYRTILERNNKSNKHYTKRYINFIFGCIKKNIDLPEEVYTENHHILPKSIWPEYSELNLNPWNCSVLTARQHLIAHWILAKAIDSQGMWYAFKVMMFMKNSNQNRYIPHKRTIEIATRRHSSKLREWCNAIDDETGLSNAKLRSLKVDYDLYRENLGCSLREFMSSNSSGDKNVTTRSDVKEKISRSIKKWHETNENPFKGKKHSEESLEKMKSKKEGSNNPCYNKIWVNNGSINLRVYEDQIPDGFIKGRMKMKQEKITCPHCGKEGGVGSIKRYHLDNCKSKP